MTAGTGLLTLNDAVSKYLMEQYPIGQVICLRQGAALLFLLPYAWIRVGLGALRVTNYSGQALRACLFIVGVTLMMGSLHRLPLAFVTAVLFSSPLFVALLSAPVLGERVHAQQWIAIAAGFAGVLLIVRPGGGGYAWVVALPVAAAFVNGLRDAVTRRLSRTDSSLSVLFWSGLAVLVAASTTIAFGWDAVDASGTAWFLVAGLCHAAAHFFVIEAFRLGNAVVVAPFRYSGLLWAMLAGFLIWREVPDAAMLAGAAVVVCAGIYMLRVSREKLNPLPDGELHRPHEKFSPPFFHLGLRWSPPCDDKERADMPSRQYYAPDPRTRERAYSRAVITEGGKTIWLAGQTATAGDFEAQTREIFAKLDETIKGAGGKGLRDMVTMTVFINDPRHGDRFTQIRKEIFKDNFPASALITVSAFARPEILIEIQGVAVTGVD
jgi:drug/metabolite transporter (DMT)-like permease/enamine deaminase RidA (YjgF/YER057c/UK114 family)